MAEEQQKYYVYGLNGSTGNYLEEPLTAEEVGDAALRQVEGQSSDEATVVKARAHRQPTYSAAMGVDVRELSEAGWAVVLAKDADAAIKDALQPLLAHRQEGAGDLFKIYEGDDGYLPGDTWESFRLRHRIGPGLAKPEQMPFYVLIAGDPATIPYDFQYLADVERALGRIYFDTPEEYAYYAQSVVRAETGTERLQLPRRATFFGTRNPDDRATRYSSEELVAPLAEELAPTLAEERWHLDVVAAEQATKARLGELLGGPQTPSLLFTATHGAGFDTDDALYPGHQGALVTQDWPGPYAWNGRLEEDFLFSAQDVADAAQLWGMIAVFFACFGAGTPRLSDFFHLREQLPGERLHLADEPLLAPLPRRLLSHPKGGALAVAGHVERAWTTSFKEGPGPLAQPDLDAFKELFRLLMMGYPLGAALEDMNTRYAQYSVQITHDLYPVTHQGRAYTDELKDRVARLWTANNDARNYIIVGDPAVRLPVARDGTGTTERPVLPAFEMPRLPERREPERPAPEPEPPAPERAARAAHASETEAGTKAAGGEETPEALWVAVPPEELKSDPELLAYWRRHIKTGYEQNDEMFRRILDAFLGPYHLTVWMYAIMFAVGIGLFATGVWLSIWFNEPLFALAFAGLGVVPFLGYFVTRPLRSLEENLEFITWLGMIYNTYWSRVVAASNPKTTQKDLQAASDDALAALERMIDKHAKLSGKRPQPGK